MANSISESDPLRVIGVIPAAGQATRMGRMAGSKEVLEIAGRPVMQFLVDRMQAAHCDEIRLVTRLEKKDVVELARELGADVWFGQPATMVDSVLLAIQDLQSDDVVLLGFPDTIWEPVDGFLRLREALSQGHDAALGLFLGYEPERSDVVALDQVSGTVKEVLVKPSSPKTNLVWGCCAVRAGELKSAGWAKELGEFLDDLCRRVSVAGIQLSDVFVDIGTMEALTGYRGLAYTQLIARAKRLANTRRG